jgi:uncharacterized protein YjbK
MEPSRNLEIEIKLLLGSFPDYLKLVGFLGPLDEEQHHANGFFDTQDRRLARQGRILRVRAEKDRGLVTLKGVGSHAGVAVIREEIEAEIELGVALEILRGFANPLALDIEPIRALKKEFRGLDLILLLEFRNERRVKHMAIGDYQYALEIDKTEFADGSVDYELEVEVSRREQIEIVEDQLRKLFESLAIPFEKQCQSKFERALQRV